MDKSLFIEGSITNIDTRIIENRHTTECNVCGCLLNDLTLIDDFVDDDTLFLTKQGRLLYNLAKFLRRNEVKKFDEVTYLTSIPDGMREKLENEVGGWEQISSLMDVISTKNWDTYCENFNKGNVLITLSRRKYPIFEPIQFNNGNFGAPIKLIVEKNLTSSEIIEWYDSQLTNMITKINSSKIVEDTFCDFDDKFLKSIDEKEELGVSFGDAGVDINGERINVFPFMSGNILGLKHGTLNAFGACSGVGKSTYIVNIIMALITKGEKGIFVSNEAQVKDIKIQFLIWYLTRYMCYWKITKTKLIKGDLTDEEREIIREASASFNERFGKMLRIITIADADMGLTAQLIKKSIQRDGATFFVLDTFKLSFDGEQNDNSWLSLVNDTRKLNQIALKYNVIGLMTLQLSVGTDNTSFLTGRNIAGAKAIIEVLTTFVPFRKAVPSLEFDPNSPYYIHPFRSKQREDGTWYEEPYEPDKTKTWRIFFVDKTRRGSGSGDTGIAYLSRFDGEYGSYYETAKCRPSRKLFQVDK